jgi:hypothetical protein
VPVLVVVVPLLVLLVTVVVVTDPLLTVVVEVIVCVDVCPLLLVELSVFVSCVVLVEHATQIVTPLTVPGHLPSGGGHVAGSLHAVSVDSEGLGAGASVPLHVVPV